MILVDTDILIQYSRRDDTAATWLDERFAAEDLAISVITEMELIFGSQNRSHLTALRQMPSEFSILQIDENISLRGSALSSTTRLVTDWHCRMP